MKRKREAKSTRLKRRVLEKRLRSWLLMVFRNVAMGTPSYTLPQLCQIRLHPSPPASPLTKHYCYSRNSLPITAARQDHHGCKPKAASERLFGSPVHHVQTCLATSKRFPVALGYGRRPIPRPSQVPMFEHLVSFCALGGWAGGAKA